MAINFWVGFVGGIQTNSITILLMVLSKIFVIKIRDQTEAIRQTMKISPICRQIVELRDSVDSINRLMGSTVFIKIVINGIFISSSFCVMADNLNRQSPNCYIIFALVFTLFAQNLDLFITSQSSQHICDAMRDLSQSTENRISRNEFITIADKQKFDLILSLKEKICFRSGQVFDISLRTYLYVLNVTATYAIILIQTD